MAFLVERRQNWSRIIGVERRGASVPMLFGRPLPDPTKLEDEDFQAAQPPPSRDRNARMRRFPLEPEFWATLNSPMGPRRIRMRLRRRGAHPR